MEVSCMGVNIRSLFLRLFPLMILTLASPNQRNEVDRISLLAFKSGVVSDPLGILGSWNDSASLCDEWRGITCSRRHQRVIALDLQSSQLTGILSPHIGNLSFLRCLNLQNNNLTHTIPQEVGRLSRLQLLHLGDNSFQGDIPINISRCSNLQYLLLANNTLSGILPMQLGLLFNLQVLSLRRNNFSGEIPPYFGNLSSLQFLSMEENNLEGGLMNSGLGRLKSLKVLALGTNELSGTIPLSIYNLSSIEHISVIQNQLRGALPSGLGYKTFPNLQIFQFQTNFFSGPIPFTISNASHLSQFGISDNKFTGKVPSLARMSNLVRLELDDNNLRNEDGDLSFLSSLVNCTSLERVDISGNNFQGVLPESISNFSTKLKVLSLGRNQLGGSISVGIGNLINLFELNFEQNLLTGRIPSSICKPSKLYNLFLNHNQLSGTIPSCCMGNVTLLSRLNLMSNKLHGGLPKSLGQCKFLLALVLSHNQLGGYIPPEVVGSASLSQLQDLDLSSNQFTGYIPNEIGSLSKLLSLNLSENRLSGEIPEGLRFMEQIQDVDLSRNNLSGTIPDYFQSLRFLNLSFNDLEGEVSTEGVFMNTSAVSLMGNIGLCGGVPQLNLPKCRRNQSGQSDISKKNSTCSICARLDQPSKLNISHISSFFAIGVTFALCCVLRHRPNKRKAAKAKLTFLPLLDTSLLKLSYGDLLQATDGFSSRNMIGAGRSGSVYWGVLDHQEERIVAVKVLNLQNSRASERFLVELEVLKSIRHRNLVKLVSACSSVDVQGNQFKALVFEFMLDGNLDEWLHYSAHTVVGTPTVQVHLNFTQRVNIAIDVANALDYLHSQFHIPIVHCDLKPSNILLEKDMTARVCDFGLATYLPDSNLLNNSSDIIKGSIGYFAPEYGMGGAASTYGDVYSYGILLLEMLTGKRPTDDMFSDDMNLHNFVLMALPQRVKEICDPVFLSRKECRISTNRDDVHNDETQRVEECLISFAKIGVACSVHMPKVRMEIKEVLAELRVIKDVLTGTRKPREHRITA